MTVERIPTYPSACTEKSLKKAFIDRGYVESGRGKLMNTKTAELFAGRHNELI